MTLLAFEIFAFIQISLILFTYYFYYKLENNFTFLYINWKIHGDSHSEERIIYISSLKTNRIIEFRHQKRNVSKI